MNHAIVFVADVWADLDRWGEIANFHPLAARPSTESEARPLDDINGSATLL